jgi:hypothetical protein
LCVRLSVYALRVVERYDELVIGVRRTCASFCFCKVCSQLRIEAAMQLMKYEEYPLLISPLNLFVEQRKKRFREDVRQCCRKHSSLKSHGKHLIGCDSRCFINYLPVYRTIDNDKEKIRFQSNVVDICGTTRPNRYAHRFSVTGTARPTLGCRFPSVSAVY